MIGAAGWGTTFFSLGVALVAALVACVPAVARGVGRAMDALRAPSAKVRACIAAALFVTAARYFPFSAEHAGRSLIPVFHDEYMYLLQARMLSVGRLWMPQHPLADFFDSILIQVKPVYAAPYFPGTAIMYVPGVWLGLAPWATSVVIAGLVVTLTYLAFTELTDGVGGLLAAAMLVATEQMRTIAVMTMSHTAVMLLLLVAVLAWSRWSRGRSIGWAAVLGAALGWALITRPLDTLCFTLPMVIAVAWDARRAVRWKTLVVALAVAACAAAPFVALQLVFDRGVTGHWLASPIGQYGRENFPGLDFGFYPREPSAQSSAALPQLRDYFVHFLQSDLARHGGRGFWRTWVVDRVPPLVEVSLPNVALALLIPIGVWRLRRCDGRHAALAAFPLLLSLTYAFYPSYLRHYGLPASAGVVLLVLLGAGQCVAWTRDAWPALRGSLAVGMLSLAVASLPEINGSRDRFPSAPYLVDVEVKLADLEHRPAVVLFKYETGRTDVDEEPVYNLDAAWPDDAPVIRAQDRGADNVRLYKYYAERGPARFFYRYDRGTGELTPLGWASDLAAK